MLGKLLVTVLVVWASMAVFNVFVAPILMQHEDSTAATSVLYAIRGNP